MEAQTQEQKVITHREILERGLLVFRKALDQGITVNREEMCDALNFEVAVASLIANMKATEGKSHEELLELAKKSLSQD